MATQGSRGLELGSDTTGAGIVRAAGRCYGILAGRPGDALPSHVGRCKLLILQGAEIPLEAPETPVTATKRHQTGTCQSRLARCRPMWFSTADAALHFRTGELDW